MERSPEFCKPGAEMTISADPANLGQVRTLLRQLAEKLDLPEDQSNGIILAVDEALTNIIRHGYGGPCDKPIRVQARCRAATAERPEALEFVIRDFGRQVDPKTIKGRDLEDVRPGGLGVHIIRSVMDEVEYTCPVEGGMQLRMLKYCCRAGGDGGRCGQP